MMKKYFVRLRRYLLFLDQYFLYEKPRGLDFTMRDKKLLIKSHGTYSGYAKTSKKHVKEIFKKLLDKENKTNYIITII